MCRRGRGDEGAGRLRNNTQEWRMMVLPSKVKFEVGSLWASR